MSEPVEVSFLAHFAALRDPRQVAKVLYPVPEILAVGSVRHDCRR
jgi:hypothetical protein